jgi:hypothetical protein
MFTFTGIPIQALKRSIATVGGIIEAIITASDGTVFKGNGRLACVRKLNEEAKGKDSRWHAIKAVILPPGVDRRIVERLLGEMPVAYKKEGWAPVEHAAHLYSLHNRGYTDQELAGMYRESKSYINAKVRAYKLMAETFVPLAQDDDHQIKNPDRYWSWFEEFYKMCKPSSPGKENPARVYDGRELEKKFCSWVVVGKLQKPEQIRKLARLLDNRDAIKVFERYGIERVVQPSGSSRNSLRRSSTSGKT